MLFIIRHAVQRRRWSNEISFWVKVHSPWMFEVFSPEMFDGHYVPLNRALFLFIQIIETEPQGVSLYVIINCQASNVEENCVIWEQSLRQISNVTAACGNIDAVWRRLNGNGVHLNCAASMSRPSVRKSTGVVRTICLGKSRVLKKILFLSFLFSRFLFKLYASSSSLYVGMKVLRVLMVYSKLNLAVMRD